MLIIPAGACPKMTEMDFGSVVTFLTIFKEHLFRDERGITLYNNAGNCSCTTEATCALFREIRNHLQKPIPEVSRWILFCIYTGSKSPLPRELAESDFGSLVVPFAAIFKGHIQEAKRYQVNVLLWCLVW